MTNPLVVPITVRMPVEDEEMKNPVRILTGLVAALWMLMGTHVMGQGTLAPTNASPNP